TGRHMVLRGVTGSGKTYSIANVVASVNRPTLVISPNKTLAAQLFSEFRAFFPANAVEYFVSYYDYYQPEAYIPQSDTYIEKDALVNDEIDRMRHSATKSLLERRDVVVVASASCIYGIGAPDTYQEMHLSVAVGEELEDRLIFLRGKQRLLEAQRLEQRTLFDMEMLRELGFCHGIENYSRHLTGKRPGEHPPTLMNYLPADALVIIDESHVAVPQIGGMYWGDRSRNETLVEYGFRMPSAFDNRPLNFTEFAKTTPQTIYVSATPGDYELRLSGEARAEQVIRPTGLMDPKITVRPAGDQVDDLLHEIRLRAERDERVLVTTLTKRMAEDLTEYYQQAGIRVRYLHSDIDTLDRMAIIRDLRLGKFDCLVGINLLREGLDIPEVSLVAILDADKEGYLRSGTS